MRELVFAYVKEVKKIKGRYRQKKPSLKEENKWMDLDVISQSLGFGDWGSLDHVGGIIFICWVGSSSFLTSSSSKTSLENAYGLTLIQFCKATNGCTQSEPCTN